MSNKISHPEHYTYSDIEPIDAIQSWNLDFCLGNVVKYIVRAGRKEGNTILDDLRKARQYLDFEIEFLQNDSDKSYAYSSPITEEDLREMYMTDDGK